MQTLLVILEGEFEPFFLSFGCEYITLFYICYLSHRVSCTRVICTLDTVQGHLLKDLLCQYSAENMYRNLFLTKMMIQHVAELKAGTGKCKAMTYFLPQIQSIEVNVDVKISSKTPRHCFRTIEVHILSRHGHVGP